MKDAIHIEVTDRPIEVGAQYAAMLSSGSGAVVLFSGNVRDQNEGKAVSRLYYEAYDGMVQSVLQQIAEEALERWGLARMALVQRVGWIPVGEPAVIVLASHAHRDQAFQAARYGIDELKRRAPIWKKEIYADGSESWVACHHHGPEPHVHGHAQF